MLRFSTRVGWLSRASPARSKPKREIILASLAFDGKNNFMARTSSQALPRVARLLVELGENVRLARKRRGLSALLVAERAGMSRPTLRAIERGDAGVTLGALANVLHSLGLERDLATVARADSVGRALQDAALTPKPRAATRKREPEHGQ